MSGARQFKAMALMASTWMLALAAAGPADAATIQVNGTFAGNDCAGVFGQPFADCKIPASIDPNEPAIIIKFNFSDGTPGVVEINSGLFPSIDGSEFDFDFDDPVGKTGTWTYTPGPGDPAILYWVAKGGPKFNLFTDDSGNPVMSGEWFTPLNNGGQQAALSHISFYDPEIAVVPWPSALIVLGAGMIGLAARRRRATIV